MEGGVRGKVKFSSPGNVIPNFEENTLCFAGQDDELVVGASADHGLYVWSLPSDQLVAGNHVVDQPLVVLRGHKGDIWAVRYNHQMDMLASAGREKILCLWMPIDHQQ